jgi:hypothetical protein
VEYQGKKQNKLAGLNKHKKDDAGDPIIAWATPPAQQNTRSNPRKSAETYLDFPPLTSAATSPHFPMRAPCYVKHIDKASATPLQICPDVGVALYLCEFLQNTAAKCRHRNTHSRHRSRNAGREKSIGG